MRSSEDLCRAVVFQVTRFPILNYPHISWQGPPCVRLTLLTRRGVTLERSPINSFLLAWRLSSIIRPVGGPSSLRRLMLLGIFPAHGFLHLVTLKEALRQISLPILTPTGRLWVKHPLEEIHNGIIPIRL